MTKEFAESGMVLLPNARVYTDAWRGYSGLDRTHAVAATTRWVTKLSTIP